MLALVQSCLGHCQPARSYFLKRQRCYWQMFSKIITRERNSGLKCLSTGSLPFLSLPFNSLLFESLFTGYDFGVSQARERCLLTLFPQMNANFIRLVFKKSARCIYIYIIYIFSLHLIMMTWSHQNFALPFHCWFFFQNACGNWLLTRIRSYIHSMVDLASKGRTRRGLIH